MEFFQPGTQNTRINFNSTCVHNATVVDVLDATKSTIKRLLKNIFNLLYL